MTTTVPVNCIYPSIQGEGAHTGTPMVIVRLQGCDVGCPWCDTKETWEVRPELRVASLEEVIPPAKEVLRNTQSMQVTDVPVDWMTYCEATPYAVAEMVARLGPNIDWVLITGGEPAQYDLRSLVEALHHKRKKVAIETSGTQKGHVISGADWICVSPKIGMPGGERFDIYNLDGVDEIKWVVGKQADVEALEQLLETAKGLYVGLARTIISLQPLSQSPKATKICIEAARDHGWHVSIQTHKLLQIP